MTDEVLCPRCLSPLLDSGACPFEGCGNTIPDWIIDFLDEEYWEEPTDLF